MAMNSSNNLGKDENNSLGLSEAFGDQELTKWMYPLAGYLLLAFVASELGNISLLISMHKKQLDTVTAIFIKGITVSGIINGFFVLLPIFTALVGGGWLLGYTGCVIQGIVGNVLSIVTHSMMLCLAFERYSAVVNRKELKERTDVSKLFVFVTFLVAAVIGSLPLVRSDYYQYIEGMYGCKLQVDLFSMIFDTFTAIIPALVVLFFTISSVVKLGKYGRMNRIMDCHMATANDGNASLRNFERRSRLRASLFPRETEGNMTSTPSGITVAQSKATVALAFFNIPLSLLSLLSFGFKFAALKVFLDSSMHLLLRLSVITSVFESVIQPYILLSASSALRKAFINFLRQRNENITPTFRVIGVSPVARPREDAITSSEMPDFLRPSSSMRIQVRVSSSVDLREQCTDGVVDVQTLNGDVSGEILDVLSLQSPVDFNQSERNASGRTSMGSVDSVFVRVGTSFDARNRWSLSTGSIITLDLPDDNTVPYSRPRSYKHRCASENHDEQRLEGSVTSQKLEETFRRQTLPPNINGNTLGARHLTSQYQGNRKRMPCRMSTGDNYNNLLPSVQDLGSKECSPRTSEQMSVKKIEITECQNTGKKNDDEREDKPTNCEITKIEITDLTEVESQSV